MKKTLFILIFAFMGSMATVSVAEAQTIIAQGTCGDNLTWTLTDDGVLAVDGSGKMYDYGHYDDLAPWNSNRDKIKTVIIGDKVTTIGDYSFANCSNSSSAIIGNAVITIGNGAFMYCIELTSAIIGNSVATIGNNAFYFCYNLTSIDIPNSVVTIGMSAFYYCFALTSIEIPNSVVTIGSSAFLYCSGLISVIIGDAVTTIGEGAFYDCTNLKSVILGNAVATIETRAFYECRRLTLIVIPTSVHTMGYGVFSSCSDLTSIDVDDNNPNYSSKEGVLYNKLQDTLICCPGGKTGTVIIPSSVTTIGNFAFYDCRKLTSMTIPNSVITIGNYAFEHCLGLISITIPNSVTTIGHLAFYYCTHLTSIEIPNAVNVIKESTFGYCRELTSVIIPDCVTTIENTAFTNCDRLKTVTIGKDVAIMGSTAFNGCNLDTIICKPTTPPDIKNYTFSGMLSNAYIIVPCHTSSIYRDSDWGKIFTDFEEDCTTGLHETFQNETITIYPNPAQNVFFVECENFTSVTIKLYDMLGREILIKNATGKAEIDISDLPKGMYHAVAFSAGGVVGNRKIVKD